MQKKSTNLYCTEDFSKIEHSVKDKLLMPPPAKKTEKHFRYKFDLQELLPLSFFRNSTRKTGRGYFFKPKILIPLPIIKEKSKEELTNEQ